jgi:hypothetical protein
LVKRSDEVIVDRARSVISGIWTGIALCAATVEPALAKTIVSCGGAALLGGAQLLCSHLDPREPPQLCTFSWALATPANQTQIVEGSFLLPPGASNVQVYQGAGFVHAMSGPIVLCQGKRQPR